MVRIDTTQLGVTIKMKKANKYSPQAVPTLSQMGPVHKAYQFEYYISV
jgi:hypothetical protein